MASSVLRPATRPATPPVEVDEAPQRYARAVRVALALVAVAGAVATGCRSGLSWDGSYILLATLHEQRPFITHGRLTSNLLLWPVVGLSGVTSNVYVLAAAFTAVWAAVPFVALLLSWLVVRRRRPALILWPAMGICVVTLPGQFFFASEALGAAQLFWPVVAWVCVGAPRRWLPCMAAICVAVALLHPAGGGLLLVGGCALGVLAWRRPSRRRLLAAGGSGLVIAGAVRIAAIENTGYEGSSFRAEVLRDHFANAVLGAPLLALLATSVVLLATALPAARARDHVRGVALGVAAVAMLVWAAQPTWWAEGLNYRSWGAIVSAGFMALLVVTALVLPDRGGKPDPPGNGAHGNGGHGSTRGPDLRAAPDADRGPWLVAAAGGLFALVVTVQSVGWAHALERLSEALPAEGCAPVAGVVPGARTAAAHWGVRSTSLLLQGRKPRSVLTDADVTCAGMGTDDLPLAPYEATRRQGWFDLSGIGRP
jgi:hypothetical protein